MKCWYCNSKLIWGADFIFDEYGYDGNGIVSTFTCSGCPAQFEGLLRDPEN